MTPAISRALMLLAVHSLGNDRSAWGLAMEAEFEAARKDGRELAFAAGCLVAAWRILPTHAEGRFAIATHLFAFLVILPVSAVLAGSVFAGFPSSFPSLPAEALLETSRTHPPLLNDANRSAVPSLLMLILALAALNLRIGWLALDRNWTRIVAVAALAAATTATLVIVSAVVFHHCVGALPQAAALTIELIGVAALARWHKQLSSSTTPVPLRFG